MKSSDSKGFEVISDPKFYDLNESTYLQVRSKEGRILSDEQVEQLPAVSKDNPHGGEWELRKRSYKRLCRFLKEKKPTSLLDVGCGNGWLIGNLSLQLPKCQLHGVDLNQVELEQASRIFSAEYIRFYYLDLVKDSFFDENTFDLIVFNASIQYFRDLPTIVAIAQSLLKPEGSIVINDSSLYPDAVSAKEASYRSEKYYDSIGFPKMANHYFHHTEMELRRLGFKKYFSWTTMLRKYHFPLFIYSKA